MLENLGIKARIITGFSLVVFLVCLVGFAGYRSLSVLTNNIDRVDDVNFLVRQIHKARQEEKNFMLTEEHEAISLVEQNIRELGDGARRIQTNLTQAQEQEQIERVVTAAEAYLTAFQIYVDLTDRKTQLRRQLQNTNQIILEHTEAFRQDQEARLAQARKEAATLREEYKQKAHDALQLFKWTVEAETLRSILMYEEEFVLLAQWKALNHKITGLTVDLKTRLKTAQERTRAETILASFKEYESAFLTYQVTRDPASKDATLNTAKSAMQEMDAIRIEQDTEYARVDTQAEKAMNTVSKRTAFVFQLIQLFQDAHNNEMAFSISGKQNNIDHVDQLTKAFLDLVNELHAQLETPALKEQLTSIAVMMNGYRTTFSEFAELTQKQVETKQHMLEAARTVETLCDETKAAQETQLVTQKSRSQNVIVFTTLGIIMLSVVFSIITIQAVVHPVTELAHIAEAITYGDFDRQIHIRQHDEIGMLAGVFQQMRDIIGDVIRETQLLTRAVKDGNLSARGNPDNFSGSWRDLVVGVNNVIDAFVPPITTTAATIDQIAKGGIPDRITTEFNGDFNTIKKNLNVLIEATETTARIAEEIAGGNLEVDVQERSEHDRLMKALHRMIQRLNQISNEMRTLVLSVQKGNLSLRGDAKAFEGGWQELVTGVNSLIDAFVEPITVTARALDRIARGDIPGKITREYRGDFNEIKQNLNLLIDTTNAITQLAEEMASGNLAVEVENRSEQDVLMQALKLMLTKLNEVVLNVKAAANQVAAGSQQMHASSDKMAQGAAQQASATGEVSASMVEIAANIQHNADNALQTEQIALQSAQYAEASGKVVAETVAAMQQITTKIAIIQEIAEQTQILSFNAAILAAQAQEHGRGFSVVASEIRSLSDMTQTAAQEIDTLTHSSLSVAKNAREMLAKLVPDIGQTAGFVQEISAASVEQRAGTEQINAALQLLDEVTQQNVQIDQDVAIAAQELAAQSEHLRSAMKFFKIAETAQASLQQNLLPDEQ